jgi:CubicO group peptidase (beta-lactamase class C family)
MATAIMLLAEEGRVGLDAPVSAYVAGCYVAGVKPD